MKMTPFNSSMDNTEYIECEDEYEAEKLVSILSLDNQLYRLKGATSVDKKEIVMVLGDNSAHSVVLSDEVSASRLYKIMEKILYEGKKLEFTQTSRNIVYIHLR
jgi:DNA integrity scanning protein DisA with diadenylate cyclase activity